MIEQYEHHGTKVFVDSELKGKHREHCLCYKCKEFTPENRNTNCGIASLLFQLCCLCNITTPVWECPNFVHATCDKQEPDGENNQES